VALPVCDLGEDREPTGGLVQIDEVSTRGGEEEGGVQRGLRRRRNGPLNWEMIRIKAKDGKFNSVRFTA
jgi:hypothetical protein